MLFPFTWPEAAAAVLLPGLRRPVPRFRRSGLFRDVRPAWACLLAGQVVVNCDAEDDQADAGDIAQGRDLAEHEQADDGRGGREQREHQGEGGAGQARHRQLVGDIRDHR
jgi:hypothetical protein